MISCIVSTWKTVRSPSKYKLNIVKIIYNIYILSARLKDVHMRCTAEMHIWVYE